MPVMVPTTTGVAESRVEPSSSSISLVPPTSPTNVAAVEANIMLQRAMSVFSPLVAFGTAHANAQAEL